MGQRSSVNAVDRQVVAFRPALLVAVEFQAALLESLQWVAAARVPAVEWVDQPVRRGC